MSKFMTAITDKSLRDKSLEEKKVEMRETIGTIKQNTYKKINKQYRKQKATPDIKSEKR